MRLVSGLFLAGLSWSCVAFSALDRPRAGFLQDVLESSTADQKYCKPSGLIEDACCGFEDVEQVNKDLFSSLHDIVATPYFRYHKVDLFRECPFWQEDGSCMNRACSVETTEEEDVPEAWRSQNLGKLKENSFPKQDPVAPPCDCSEADFCVLEDELDSEGHYVDLLGNPERFTGYAGASASRVWKAIYEENCFTKIPFIDPSRAKEQGGSGFVALGSGAQLGSFGLPTFPGTAGAPGFGSLAGPRDEGEEVCLEKRVFYRLISGLHASISIHICDEYLDQKTGEWSPNLECFITRIGEHPERLQNVYFTYVVLLRALAKSGPQLVRTLGATAGDQDTVAKFNTLLGHAQGCPTTFDEGSMFSGPEAETLKLEFKEHFRNVSRIMDCVGCDKCRLWGKLQVTGLGTALKLLFSYDDASGRLAGEGALADHEHAAFALSRSEVVAFVNTLHRLSESLGAVEKFRTLWQTREAAGLEAGGVSGGGWAGERDEAYEVDNRERDALARPEVGAGAAPASERVEEDVLLVAATRSVNPSSATPAAQAGASTSEETWAPHAFLSRLLERCQEGWRSCLELWESVVVGVWKGRAGQGPASGDGRVEL